MTDANRYFYLTTAIDYPNSRPHIGTAFEKIGADAQARYRRMEGYRVHFQMGNDENTIKVSQRALSTFESRLLEHYEAHPEFIQPESRRNEIISLVKSGLQDVSISRKGYTWGIPVPFDPEQMIHVWFDALLNYITAVGYGSDEDRFQADWPADVHVIGKDITRFHCALWPAMLMSAGLPLPRQVFAHGFVYNKGAKISKSAGTAIDPMDVFKVHGADAFRYYFLKECPFGGDGNFSKDPKTDGGFFSVVSAAKLGQIGAGSDAELQC